MNKIIDFYVNLYIGEDKENFKPRHESSRIWWLITHFAIVLSLSTGLLTIVLKCFGKLAGVLK